VGTSPHAQLRKILNADLEELTKIINANPHLVKSSALAKMLVKEKIIVPKS
jgi:hypothetical protein